MNELIDKILKETRYNKNPYFTNLRNGDFSKEDFVETQIQFFFLVSFFSRPMAALAAKIPSPKLRLAVLENVWEEHGEGDVKRIHAETFVELLKRLDGVTAADIQKRALWPEARIFNTALVGACVVDEYLIGAAMLGMIERMFCDISAWVGQGIVERGWIPHDNMIHYNLHEKLDIKHSQDFFNVLLPAWNESPENRYYIEQGLRSGAALFNSMYEGLYRNRQRRLFRDITGPHSRA